MTKGRTAIAAAAGAAVMALFTPVLAGPVSLGDLLQLKDDRRQPLPTVARFVVGDDSFVLDRTRPQALLRFEDSQEIWLLSPAPAPRGDTIYRDDAGHLVLRATKLGGMTLFTPTRPDGAPAALQGEADEIRPPVVLSPGALFQHLAQDSIRAGRAAQRLVPFEALGVTPGAEPMFADAGAVAAEAIVRIARRGDGRELLSRVQKVRLTAGRRSDVRLRDGVMEIWLQPAAGIAGRPSSERIAIIMANSR